MMARYTHDQVSFSTFWCLRLPHTRLHGYSVLCLAADPLLWMLDMNLRLVLLAYDNTRPSSETPSTSAFPARCLPSKPANDDGICRRQGSVGPLARVDNRHRTALTRVPREQRTQDLHASYGGPSQRMPHSAGARGVRQGHW